MKRLRQSLNLALALSMGTVLLAGCGVPLASMSGQEGSLSAMAKKPKAGAIQVLVSPEMSVKPIVSAIQGAKKSVQLEMYMFTDHDDSAQLVQALIGRAKAGVDVQVILEAHPYLPPSAPSPGQPAVLPTNPNTETAQALIAGGVRVKRSSPKFNFTHEKGMVIDGATAYIMTTNFTNSAFSTNREYVVVDQDPGDVNEVATIFNCDWQETVYQPKDPNMVVSPNNSRQRLLGLIDSAKKTIVLQSEFLTDPEVAQHLGDRAKAGVDVKIMLAQYDKDPYTGRDSNADEVKLLNSVGVTQVAFPNKLKVHAKAMVVDNARAYVGSENFTANSLDNNRELGILLTDTTAIGTLSSTMASDWGRQ